MKKGLILLFVLLAVGVLPASADPEPEWSDPEGMEWDKYDYWADTY